MRVSCLLKDTKPWVYPKLDLSPCKLFVCLFVCVCVCVFGGSVNFVHSFLARQIGDKIVQKLIKLYFWRPNYATRYFEQILIKGQVRHVPVFKMAAIFKMAAVLSENLRKNMEIDTLKVLFPGHRRVPVTIMFSGHLSGHSSTHTHTRPSICPSVRPFVVLYTLDPL